MDINKDKSAISFTLFPGSNDHENVLSGAITVVCQKIVSVGTSPKDFIGTKNSIRKKMITTLRSLTGELEKENYVLEEEGVSDATS